MKRDRKLETIIAQAGVGADKAYGAVSAPIYTAAIYRYDGFGRNRGFDYSRGENPTRQAAEKIAFAQKAIGAVPSPFDCWLLLRGIKTLAVRATRAQESAGALVEFLSTHPAVGKIYYPGLPDHPRRELHFSQASGGSNRSSRIRQR